MISMLSLKPYTSSQPLKFGHKHGPHCNHDHGHGGSCNHAHHGKTNTTPGCMGSLLQNLLKPLNGIMNWFQTLIGGFISDVSKGATGR